MSIQYDTDLNKLQSYNQLSKIDYYMHDYVVLTLYKSINNDNLLERLQVFLFNLIATSADFQCDPFFCRIIDWNYRAEGSYRMLSISLEKGAISFLHSGNCVLSREIHGRNGDKQSAAR